MIDPGAALARAKAESSAKAVAQRLIQALGTNPTPEWFAVAIPLIATAILDSRSDLAAEASRIIQGLSKALQRAHSTTDEILDTNDALGG